MEDNPRSPSTGPSSPEGKAGSACNSEKHGMYAHGVLLHHESVADFAALWDDYYRQFSPNNRAESDLVDRMIAATWRLRRLSAFESAALDHTIDAQRARMDTTYQALDPETRAHSAFAHLATEGFTMHTHGSFQAAQLRHYDRALRNSRLLREIEARFDKEMKERTPRLSATSTDPRQSGKPANSSPRVHTMKPTENRTARTSKRRRGPPAIASRIGKWYNLKTMRYAILAALSTLLHLNAQTTDPNRTGFPHDMIWFNEPKNAQPGVTHHGYHSASMNKEIGYNIWLPPDYVTSSRRYPVVYWLHGRNNTESSDQYPVHYLAEAVEKGALPAMIMVFASGGSQTNYCDSYDGKYLGETTVIKELIPYIDQHYRTIASRDGRSIQGMSMGGFGCMRLGLKYPDLFSSIVAFAGGFRVLRISGAADRAMSKCSKAIRSSFERNTPRRWLAAMPIRSAAALRFPCTSETRTLESSTTATCTRPSTR
jgi:hypothetical protein